MNVVLAGGSPLAIVVQWNVYLRLSIDISPFIGSDWGPHTRFQPKSPLILDYVCVDHFLGRSCQRYEHWGTCIAKGRYMSCVKLAHANMHQDDVVMREKAREREWGDKVSWTKRVRERESTRERERARERERSRARERERERAWEREKPKSIPKRFSHCSID